MDNTQQTADNIQLQDEDVSVSQSGNLITIDDIQMELPDSWSFIRKDEYNSIYIRTDYKPYDVDLVIDYRKNPKLFKEDYKDTRGGYDYTKIADGEIFKVPCGGALACTGAIIGNDIYEIGFLVESNQNPPENLGELWTPDNNITDDKIWDIMLSIQKIN